jgi:hypothetical protein
MSAFFGGALHPLLVPAHVIALLALGLLIGRQTHWLPSVLAFAAALAAALSAIALAVGQTPAPNVVLAAAAVTGILAAAAVPLPAFICVALAAVSGAAIGLDSPPRALTLAAATAALIGTGIGSCLVLVVLVLATRYLTRPWQRIGVRIVGSWIAASALLVLALRYVRGLLF